MFGARFDDAVSGESFLLVDPIEEFVAKTHDEVVNVIDRAAAASSAGRWVAGYVTYEAAPAFDAALIVHDVEHGPLAWFGVFESRIDVPIDEENRHDARYALSTWTPSVDEAGYNGAFQQIRNHIRAGDTYQVNLTFPLHAAFSGNPDALYSDLLAAQQPGYATHLWHGDRHILSTSPERFFAVDRQRIVTSPMKGTARRGRWLAEDEAVRAELVESGKDRAENLMIVDLIRNDLGRIAEFGTVEVEELFTVERYPTVWQMTSTVAAKVRQQTELSDVFAGLFPCGSVTGAPKARSMQIVNAVEPQPRHVYCGAVGFIPPGDGLDGASFNVAIRTVTIDCHDGIATYGVGGGITWYSDAETEYDEAVTKSLILRRHEPVAGLIETIRWDPHRKWVLLDDHLDRLSQSAAYFGLSVDIGSVRSALHEAVDGRMSATRVRLVATDGEFTVEVADAPEAFLPEPGLSDAVVQLAVDEMPIDGSDPSHYHKTIVRGRYEARAVRHPEADDVILVNEEGNITETTIANIAVLTDGNWLTPPIGDGLVGGVLRNRLVADGVLEERSIRASDVHETDAIAVMNSVRGWQPAVLIPT